MLSVLNHFQLDTPAISCEKYGCGHINETYLVTTATRRYILQKINDRIFQNVPALMENIAAVTGYLAKQTEDPRRVLSLVPTQDGKPYLQQEGYWRVYDFVEDSLCLQLPETAEDFYESAVAFGGFQQLLKDFPAHTLHEIIPNFHNTPDRYRIFRETLAKDPMGRAKEVQAEIDFVLAREEEAGTLIRLLEQGKLPLRVTHNDTKLNNVMLDAATRKALCVIDLDTVMPGLSLYDFGDSIRFGAASAAEDETDLSKVKLDLDLYECFTSGFVSAIAGFLGDEEIKLLPYGALLMTLEVGSRFLLDYLEGDKYFRIHRPEHNLERARTQLTLALDMERHFDEMNEIVRKYL